MRKRNLIILGIIAIVFLLLIGIRVLFWGEIRAYIYRNYTEVRQVKGSNWFDYPVGWPNARGYYVAQCFGGTKSHLGVDWNGIGGGNSDYGDPVYAISNGTVVFCRDAGGGWGNVIRIVHPVTTKNSIEAIYAHLADIRVSSGDKVKRGEIIGSIGDANGYYLAHLHFEVRTKAGLPLGAGYGDNRNDLFCDPNQFVDKHRCKL